MRTRPFDQILLATAALTLFSGGASALTPTLDFEEGPVASVPVTTGSISVGGVTVKGVPLVGSDRGARAAGERFGDPRRLFNPLDPDSTEYNLGMSSGEASFAAQFPARSGRELRLDWSVYYDPANAAFGQATLLASHDLANPSSLIAVGFFVPLQTASGPIEGPFSLTELLSIGGPPGEQVSFNSSIVAKVPEASTWAMMLLGFAGCGLVLRQAKRRQAARV